jgi:DNA-binding response OmpR family regulator/HPt (histidine-containing phosphotransfer) domain-containing protein
MKILIIEDDRLVADTVVSLLTSQAHAVEVAEDGAAGWSLVKAYDYDLVILDLTLPKVDGISLCRQIRGHNAQVPILILTGRDDAHTKATGLDAGADDYVVKPFDAEELLARVRALLRRSGETTQTLLNWGDLLLDPSSCQVTCHDKPVPLTPKEYALVELFLRNPKRVFSCSAILDHLWAYEEAPGEEAVRTHIKGLRQKLKAANPTHDMIETVYGIGYRLKAQEIAHEESSPEENVSPAATQEQDLKAKIQRIWQESQAQVQAQLSLIQQTLTGLAQVIDQQQDLSQHTSTQESLPIALREAHSLAGSLGTFGFAQGSTFARQLETQLRHIQQNQTITAPESSNLQTVLQQLQQEIQQANQPKAQTPINASMPLARATPSPEADQRPTLLIIDADTQLAKALLREPACNVFRIEIAKTLSSAREKIQFAKPSLILLEPDVAKQIEQSVTFLNQLSHYSPLIPTVIFTVHTDLCERRSLLQSKSHIVLPKPATPNQILDAMQQVLDRTHQIQSRVLIVDDDPKILTLAQHLLQPWGLNVTTLADPKQFWSTLEAVQPDLLILDILMPDVNGIEVCEMVRGDAQWSTLPILILTAHKDPETINQVFGVGADDFVSKPIVGPELVTRVMNRLERTKLMQRRYDNRADEVARFAANRLSTPSLVSEPFLSPPAIPESSLT